MKNNELWKNWDDEKHYGDLFYKRATGASPEMQSSGAVSRVIKEFYSGNEKLLDVGCGAGHYLRTLRKVISEDINYTGVDPTSYYIELAQKAYGDTVDFKIGSIFVIPFEDNSFDIVMCNNVVMHLPPENLQKAFDELIRVAKKKVIVRAMFGVRNYIVKEILTDNDINPETQLQIGYEDFNLNESKFRYFNSYTQDFYQQMIQKNNNVTVEIRPDHDWKQFDNIPDAKIETATRTLAEFQVSGNIILDWRFILIDKL